MSDYLCVYMVMRDYLCIYIFIRKCKKTNNLGYIA